MIKPRLTKHHGYWYCVGNKSCGLGVTPKAAYNNWVRNAIFQLQVLECNNKSLGNAQC
jgi:hypothetical protein